MNSVVQRADPANKPEPSSVMEPSKTGNSHRRWQTRLVAKLTVIKQVPWFTLLLTMLLGYGGYQVATQPHVPAHAMVRDSLVTARQSILTALFVPPSKKVTSATNEVLASVEKEPKHSTAPLEASGSLDGPLQVAQLESDYQTLKSTIHHLEIEQKRLSKDMDAIRAQLAAIKEAALYKGDASQIVEDTTQTPAQDAAALDRIVNPDYSVRAVITGRAWLNTKENQITTVSVGSQLPLLGTVQAIDTDNRLVYLDTGKIIGPPAFDC